MENGNGKWKWKNGIGAIVKKVVEHICRKLWLTCYHFVFCVQQRFFPNCPNSIFPFSISIFHFHFPFWYRCGTGYARNEPIKTSSITNLAMRGPLDGASITKTEHVFVDTTSMHHRCGLWPIQWHQLKNLLSLVWRTKSKKF